METLAVRRATAVDINALARVEWYSLKDAVNKGALPPIGVKNEHGHFLSDGTGIRNAKDRIYKILTQPRMRWFDADRNEFTSIRILAAHTEGTIIGKFQVAAVQQLHAVSLDSLEVLPQFQGRGVARRLQQEALTHGLEIMDNVALVRFGRYALSNDWEARHHPNGFFYRARQLARTITQGSEQGYVYETYYVPFVGYRRLVEI